MELSVGSGPHMAHADRSLVPCSVAKNTSPLPGRRSSAATVPYATIVLSYFDLTSETAEAAAPPLASPADRPPPGDGPSLACLLRPLKPPRVRSPRGRVGVAPNPLPPPPNWFENGSLNADEPEYARCTQQSSTLRPPRLPLTSAPMDVGSAGVRGSRGRRLELPPLEAAPRGIIRVRVEVDHEHSGVTIALDPTSPASAVTSNTRTLDVSGDAESASSDAIRAASCHVSQSRALPPPATRPDEPRSPTLVTTTSTPCHLLPAAPASTPSGSRALTRTDVGGRQPSSGTVVAHSYAGVLGASPTSPLPPERPAASGVSSPPAKHPVADDRLHHTSSAMSRSSPAARAGRRNGT